MQLWYGDLVPISSTWKLKMKGDPSSTFKELYIKTTLQIYSLVWQKYELDFLKFHSDMTLLWPVGVGGRRMNSDLNVNDVKRAYRLIYFHLPQAPGIIVKLVLWWPPALWAWTSHWLPRVIIQCLCSTRRDPLSIHWTKAHHPLGQWLKLLWVPSLSPENTTHHPFNTSLALYCHHLCACLSSSARLSVMTGSRRDHSIV